MRLRTLLALLLIVFTLGSVGEGRTHKRTPHLRGALFSRNIDTFGFSSAGYLSEEATSHEVDARLHNRRCWGLQTARSPYAAATWVKIPPDFLRDLLSIDGGGLRGCQTCEFVLIEIDSFDPYDGQPIVVWKSTPFEWRSNRFSENQAHLLDAIRELALEGFIFGARIANPINEVTP